MSLRVRLSSPVLKVAHYVGAHAGVSMQWLIAIFESEITCPFLGCVAKESMLDNARQFYSAWLRCYAWVRAVRGRIEAVTLSNKSESSMRCFPSLAGSFGQPSIGRLSGTGNGPRSDSPG